MVRTQRLTLIPVTPELLFAFQLGPDLLASVLDVALPENWPAFPEAFARGTYAPWCGFVFNITKTSQLIGNGGYVSAPDRKGNVEIGCEVAPAFRDEGYATEAARIMIDRAFEMGAQSVSVTTPAGANASNAVARKLGMRFVEDDFRHDVGPVWRYKIWREAVAEVA